MAKKKSDQAEPGRRERAAAALDAQRRRERLRTSLFWTANAAVLIVIVGAAAYGIQNSKSGSSVEGLDSVKTYDAKSDHVTSAVTYPQTPPAGGAHNPIWLNCGIYSSPVPNENAVHSMEHGAVWVTYRSDLPESDVEKLRQAMPSTYSVLSPVEDLPAPVVASAWGKQLLLDGASDDRLEKFITAYLKGPDAPEPGASCTGASDGTLPLDYADRQ